METDLKSLPSEKLQKEFENNPFKILENIRNEKEEKIGEIISPEINKNSNESSLSNEINENYISLKKNIFSNGRNSHQNIYIKKKNKYDNSTVNINVNNINKINLDCNEINYNINENSNNIKDSKYNITVNNLLLFKYNIDNTTNYVNINTIKNNECKNNNSFSEIKRCLTNYREEANSTFSQSNDEDNKNNTNIDTNFDLNTNTSTTNTFTYNTIITPKKQYNLLSDINTLLDNLKNYKGSIVSQEFIENINNEKECAILFNNILPHICKIMCLEYGNYFFQKFLKKLNLEQKLIIYQIIEPYFYDIASNKFGTHSIQSLINNIESKYEIFALSKLMNKNMYFLFINKNSYHIIMKIILDFPEEERHFLNIFLVTNVEKIIINCNGAFCINKFIVNNKNLKLRKLFLHNMQNNIKQLIFNKYCCIILLLILENFGIDWGYFIIKEIHDNFEVLCQNTVSNLFINKIFFFLNNNYRFELKVLLWSLYKNNVLMENLISNKNNNNIIKQLINFSDNEQKSYLLFLLNSNGNL